jgi:DNA-directed RNA polymerase subunit RPC12/RpoP
MNRHCPGSSQLKNPTPETIKCPKCGVDVEIWTDELKARCPECREMVFKSKAPSCIDWCQYAEQCVGPELLERLRNGGAKEGAES